MEKVEVEIEVKGMKAGGANQHNRTTQDQSKMERTGDTCHPDAAAVRVECIVKSLLCASTYVS